MSSPSGAQTTDRHRTNPKTSKIQPAIRKARPCSRDIWRTRKGKWVGFVASSSYFLKNDQEGGVSTFTPPNAVTLPCRSITIWVASWRSSAASWLT
jgi:hypothetical protein